MPEVTFVGTGEAFDPELPNTSLLYRGSTALLIDCGYRVPHALWAISRDPSLLDAIYISHLHADHSFGLPALLLWMREEGRTRPLTVIGGPGLDAWLPKLLELGYPGSYDQGFTIERKELAPGSKLYLAGAILSNAKSQHGVRNLSLRIDEQERSLCYSGDGAPSDATEALYREASLLVHECYAAQDGPSGHASLDAIASMAARVHVQSLCLVHLGRAHKTAIHDDARARGPWIRIPAPGDTVQV